KISKACIRFLKSKTAKIKNLFVKNLNAENSYSRNLKCTNTNTENLSVKNANIDNLQVGTINGTCFNEINETINQNGNFQIVFNDDSGNPIKPNNPGYNNLVWDALWNNAVLQLQDPCFGLTSRLK